jgi:hypothetical protein
LAYYSSFDAPLARTLADASHSETTKDGSSFAEPTFSEAGGHDVTVVLTAETMKEMNNL